MLLTRRKVLSGLIAAPAIIRPAKAAFWQGQTFAGGGSGFAGAIGSEFIGPNMTQVKPQGIPRINWNHPMSQGLVVDLFDVGNGQYVNLCQGNEPYIMPYGSAASSGVADWLSNGSTPYGAATLWPGLTVQANNANPGIAALIEVNLGDLTIYHANDLATKAIGVGNTLSCGIMRLPGNINQSYGWIFGRPGLSAGESSPFYDWCFVAGGNSTVITAECLTTGDSQVQIGSNYTCPNNKFVHLAATCQNSSASPGSGTGRFLTNGVLNGTTSSISMTSYNPGSVAETDLMIGCTKHMMTGESQNVWGGYIYFGRVRTRALADLECSFEYQFPYAHYL